MSQTVVRPSLLRRIGDDWKGLAAIGAAVGFGFTVSIFAFGFVGLPERVGGVETRVEVLEEGLHGVQKQLELSNCLAISEKAGTDWRQCINRHMRTP